MLRASGHRFGETAIKVLPRPPTQFRLAAGRIDGTAAVMAKPVGDAGDQQEGGRALRMEVIGQGSETRNNLAVAPLAMAAGAVAASRGAARGRAQRRVARDLPMQPVLFRQPDPPPAGSDATRRPPSMAAPSRPRTASTGDR